MPPRPKTSFKMGKILKKTMDSASSSSSSSSRSNTTNNNEQNPEFHSFPDNTNTDNDYETNNNTKKHDFRENMHKFGWKMAAKSVKALQRNIDGRLQKHDGEEFFNHSKNVRRTHTKKKEKKYSGDCCS